MKILIVDDSAMMRKVIRRAVTASGAMDIEEAVDGQDALEKLADLDELHLLVTDLNMPRLGGEGLLEALPSLGLKPEHIVVISSTVSTVRRLRLMRLGVDKVLAKPFQPERLLLDLQPYVEAPPQPELDETARILLDAALIDTLSQMAFRVSVPMDGRQDVDGEKLLAHVTLEGMAQGTFALVLGVPWCGKISEELTGESAPEDFAGELANIVAGVLVGHIETQFDTNVVLTTPVVTTDYGVVSVDRCYTLDDQSAIGVVWNLTLPKPAEV